MENLEKLTLLEELWLGKNKIRALEVSLRSYRLEWSEVLMVAEPVNLQITQDTINAI